MIPPLSPPSQKLGQVSNGNLSIIQSGIGIYVYWFIVDTQKQRFVPEMNRNSVLFSILVSFALLLCVAGYVRYDRNEAKVTFLPPSPTVPIFPGKLEIEPRFFDDYAEAVSIARQQDKPILLLFTAKNCVYSKQMLETTFQSDIVKPFLQRFVLVVIDIHGQKEICRWLSIESTPTIQFLSSQGVPLQRLNGVTQPEDLIAQMNTTLQTVAMYKRSASVW